MKMMRMSTHSKPNQLDEIQISYYLSCWQCKLLKQKEHVSICDDGKKFENEERPNKIVHNWKTQLIITVNNACQAAKCQVDSNHEIQHVKHDFDRLELCYVTVEYV